VTRMSALEQNAGIVSAFLRQHTRPMSASQIARGLGGDLSIEQTKRACEALHFAKQITRTHDRTKKGLSFLYASPRKHTKRSESNKSERTEARPMSSASRKPKREDAGSC
jgi:hypothetical protein